MTKCSVLFCKTYSHCSVNIPFHKFPSDPFRKREWVKAVRREKAWIPTKHSSICGLHFEPECYDENSKKYKKLRKDAVPSLNLPEFEDSPVLDKSKFMRKIIDRHKFVSAQRLKKIRILLQKNRSLKAKNKKLMDVIEELKKRILCEDE